MDLKAVPLKMDQMLAFRHLRTDQMLEQEEVGAELQIHLPKEQDRGLAHFPFRLQMDQKKVVRGKGLAVPRTGLEQAVSVLLRMGFLLVEGQAHQRGCFVKAELAILQKGRKQEVLEEELVLPGVGESV